MSYIPLEQTEDVDRELAADGPLWIFKHSTTCGISAHAKEAVDAYLQAHPEERAAMVVVQTHRPVSNHIAKVLDRVHQSPQLFLVKDGAVAWHTSHYQITEGAMVAARKQLA